MRRRLVALILAIAGLASTAVAIRNCSSNPNKHVPAAVPPSDAGEIVALPDRSTVLVKKGTAGQDLIDWLANGAETPKKIELGGHQFIGRTAEPSPELIGRATQLVMLLRAHPDVIVTVVGHTDPSSDPEADQYLSLARAQSVVKLLKSGGIRPSRLQAEGRGSGEPLADNRTADGRARNQRVSLVLRSKN